MIPSAEEVVILEDLLEAGDLTLKLYSNNVVPAKANTAAAYTAVSGGGYADVTLDKDLWTITPGVTGPPAVATIAQYAAQDFDFTGVTDAPGTIYGYIIVDSLNNLRGAVRFSESVVPFTPILGSKIRITPKVQVN